MKQLLAVFALASLFACNAPTQATSTPTFVNDHARALSAQTKQNLERRLAEYARETGRPLTVWTAVSFHGQSFEDWSSKIVAHQKDDDATAIFILTGEKRALIGSKNEAVLPETLADQIVDEHLVPAMRAGDGDQAITLTVEALIEKIDLAS